jgi:hypothetical protein
LFLAPATLRSSPDRARRLDHLLTNQFANLATKSASFTDIFGYSANLLRPCSPALIRFESFCGPNKLLNGSTRGLDRRERQRRYSGFRAVRHLEIFFAAHSREEIRTSSQAAHSHVTDPSKFERSLSARLLPLHQIANATLYHPGKLRLFAVALMISTKRRAAGGTDVCSR